MTENKNRVCCLYRVSTDKQVDFNSNHEADLPMQRKACHKFAEAKGWVIVHTKSMWTSTLILHSIWRIAMNLLADKHKNTVDFDLKSTVFVTLI